jgi:four helix bundle protein
MNPEELRERTKQFAHRCVKLALALPNTPLGNHIRGQFVRCSTSVASNYRAACLAQSKAHFVAKISIVTEEADESAFWLQFIIDENLLKEPRVAPLLNEADELTRIFVSGRKTAKDRGPEFDPGASPEVNNP